MASSIVTPDSFFRVRVRDSGFDAAARSVPSRAGHCCRAELNIIVLVGIDTRPWGGELHRRGASARHSRSSRDFYIRRRRIYRYPAQKQSLVLRSMPGAADRHDVRR